MGVPEAGFGVKPFANRGDRGPAIMGHRGAPRAAQENTPAAFAAAAAAGATWVELDARRSADGAVVVHHDPCTGDGVSIASQPMARLREAGLYDLATVLDGLEAGLGVDVEVKNLPGEPDYDEDDRLAVWVCDLVAARVAERPFMTSSFNPLTVAIMAATLPAVPAGLLHGDSLELRVGLDVALAHGARVVAPHVDARGLDAATVRLVHEAGLAVLVWTVDDLDRARALAEAGVDALCTNNPAALIAGL